MLRTLNAPRPLQVVVDPNGEPRAVQVRGRMTAVTRQRDCWRVEDRWWTEQPMLRIYYELQLEDGEVLTLFHDPPADRWYAQRVA